MHDWLTPLALRVTMPLKPHALPQSPQVPRNSTQPRAQHVSHAVTRVWKGNERGPRGPLAHDIGVRVEDKHTCDDSLKSDGGV